MTLACAIFSTGDEALKCIDEHDEPYSSVKKVLADEINRIYHSGYSDFYLNGEYGISLWSAEIICDMKEIYKNIRLHVISSDTMHIPKGHEDYDYRYYKVICKADDVQSFAENYYSGTYSDVDDYIIRHSDYILIGNMIGDYLRCVSCPNKKGKI